MIDDLSRTLQVILNPLADISFEPPLTTFNPPISTLNVYLYDIRENADLRSNEPIIEKKGGQAIRHLPPLRVQCSYLITAWPVGGADLPLQEQAMLAAALETLAQFPSIPDIFLQGGLAGQLPSPPLVAARADQIKSYSEFWSALGGRYRAALTVSATISLPVFADEVSPLVTTRFAQIAPFGGAPESFIQVGGIVTDLLGNPLASAYVDVLGGGLRTRTGADGRYSFLRVAPGPRTFRVIAVGFQIATQARNVPGPPGSYDFQLTPL
jgi:uncharacterized protein DUF4255/carboxypeptidase family protein